MNPAIPGPAGVVAVLERGWTWSRAEMARRSLRLPPRSVMRFDPGGCSIPMKRNAAIEDFERHEEWEWLLFLDDDMEPPAATVARLLSHNVPIIAPLMFMKLPPHSVCAGRNNPDSSPGNLSEIGGEQPLQQVDWLGTGCMLIRREVLAKVPRPWFRDNPRTPGVGEDWNFCCLAREAGVPMYCDTGWCCGHLTVKSINLDYVIAWQETAQARQMVNAAPAEGAR